jgi:hypothetical protein
MYLGFVAKIIAALIERDLRKKVVEKNIELLCSLPEGRSSKTPTIEQVLRLFENQNKHALYDDDRLIKQFADPLTPVQSANTSVAEDTDHHLVQAGSPAIQSWRANSPSSGCGM